MEKFLICEVSIVFMRVMIPHDSPLARELKRAETAEIHVYSTGLPLLLCMSECYTHLTV